MKALGQDRVTDFGKGTPVELQRILEGLRQGPGRRVRIRLFYGDTDTGKDWNEENDVTGYVGRSTGNRPILLLIPNARSTGGGAILTNRIVKLIDIGTGRVLWQHPHYHSARFRAIDGCDDPEYGAEVHQEPARESGTLYARCRDYAQAHRLAAFMNGERHSK